MVRHCWVWVRSKIFCLWPADQIYFRSWFSGNSDPTCPISQKFHGKKDEYCQSTMDLSPKQKADGYVSVNHELKCINGWSYLIIVTDIWPTWMWELAVALKNSSLSLFHKTSQAPIRSPILSTYFPPITGHWTPYLELSFDLCQEIVVGINTLVCKQSTWISLDCQDQQSQGQLIQDC